MDMKDVDFDVKYEPGKDEVDPLDFLSRHPLPIIGNNDTEILKVIIETEHAVVQGRQLGDQKEGCQLSTTLSSERH